jgi:hypothetical protein
MIIFNKVLNILYIFIMLQVLNNYWVYGICFIILLIIIRKIIILNKPFNETEFIQKYENQERLKEKLSMQVIKEGLPTLAKFYFI